MGTAVGHGVANDHHEAWVPSGGALHQALVQKNVVDTAWAGCSLCSTERP